MSNQDHCDDILNIIDHFHINAQKVYCMPLGDSVEELSKNQKFVAQFCLDTGLIFSDRLHIHLYGNLRGV